MEHADFVIQPFDETETDFVIWMAIGGDPMPMVLNHLGKLLIRFEPLPFQAVVSSFKEGAGTGLGSVIPELAEGLFPQIGGIQTPVGLEPFFRARLPPRLRFSRRDSKVYRWP